jgi:hypothetical protein
MKTLNQFKRTPRWIGGIQIQVANSSYYTVWYSQAMLVFTFWTVAGYPMAQKYAPWLSMWLFIGLMIISLVFLVILDYIFVQPSRIAFSNDQSFSHKNAAMDEILIIRADINKIKKKLEIED